MEQKYPLGLAPMSAGQIIGNSFRVFGRNFGKFAIFTLAVLLVANLIVTAVTAALGSDLLSAMGGEDLLGVLMSGDAELIESYFEYYFGTEANLMIMMNQMLPALMRLYVWAIVLGLALSILVSPFVEGGVCNVTMGYYHGVQDTAAGWFKQTLKYYGKLAGTGACMLLAGIGLALGAVIAVVILALLLSVAVGTDAGGAAALLGMLVVLAIVLLIVLVVLFIAAWFSMVYPVCAGEAVFGFSAVVRAFRLVRKKFWKSIGVTFLIAVVVGLISWVASVLLETLTGTFGNLNGMALSSVLDEVISAVLMPLTTAAFCLLYLDIRITEEGYDLQLQNLEQPEAQPQAYQPPVQTESVLTQEPVDTAAEPASAVEETPVEEPAAPAAEETPVEEPAAPAVEETPVAEPAPEAPAETPEREPVQEELPPQTEEEPEKRDPEQ